MLVTQLLNHRVLNSCSLGRWCEVNFKKIRAAIAQLPSYLQSYHPWPRRLARIHQRIREA